jgi:hypothetical protein
MRFARAEQLSLLETPVERLTGALRDAYSQFDASYHANLGLDLAQRAWRERRLN